MINILELIVAIFCSIMASSGFWMWVQKRQEKKSALARMCLGLGHDRIVHLGETYLQRGSITTDEYENLVTYLYEPYKELGGNGSAARIVDLCSKLPIKN